MLQNGRPLRHDLVFPTCLQLYTVVVCVPARRVEHNCKYTIVWGGLHACG